MIGCETWAAGAACNGPMGERDAVLRPLVFGRRVFLSLSHGCSVDSGALFFTQSASHRKINGHFEMDYVRRERRVAGSGLEHIYLFCLYCCRERYGAINRYSLRRVVDTSAR